MIRINQPDDAVAEQYSFNMLGRPGRLTDFGTYLNKPPGEGLYQVEDVEENGNDAGPFELVGDGTFISEVNGHPMVGIRCTIFRSQQTGDEYITESETIDINIIRNGQND